MIRIHHGEFLQVQAFRSELYCPPSNSYLSGMDLCFSVPISYRSVSDPISDTPVDPVSSRRPCDLYIGFSETGDCSSSGWESSTIPDVDSVRVVGLGSVPFFRRRQQRKKIKIAAIATAARTPTTIPAIAPPDMEESLPEFSGPLVAVALADAGEVVASAVEEGEDVALVVDSAVVAVERNPAVLLVTLNDLICSPET